MSLSFMAAAAERARDACAHSCSGLPAPHSAACLICLEGGDELLSPGCGCRGTAGLVHQRCAIQAAAALQERNGTWAGRQHPWQICQTCRLPYSGPLKLALAQEWCRRTERLEHSDPTQQFAARTALGNALSAAGRLAEAEDVVRANLASAAASHGAEHRMTLGTRLNLGLVLDGLGKSDEAARVYRELVEVQRRVLGPEHRDTLMSAMQLAGAQLNAGCYDEAEARYRELHEALSRTIGATDALTLTCGMNLASTCLSRGKYPEAEGLYRANLAAKLRKLGPTHVDTLMVCPPPSHPTRS